VALQEAEEEQGVVGMIEAVSAIVIGFLAGYFVAGPAILFWANYGVIKRHYENKRH